MVGTVGHAGENMKHKSSKSARQCKSRWFFSKVTQVGKTLRGDCVSPYVDVVDTAGQIAFRGGEKGEKMGWGNESKVGNWGGGGGEGVVEHDYGGVGTR